MRKWIAARRKTVVLVVLAGVYAAGMALVLSSGHPLDETLNSAAIWFVFTLASWYFDARRQRKTASKLEDLGGILVYLRYPESRPGSLSGIWNMGITIFDETAPMKFQPAVDDTLEPSGRPTTFPGRWEH
jgi:hypothetical protein